MSLGGPWTPGAIAGRDYDPLRDWRDDRWRGYGDVPVRRWLERNGADGSNPGFGAWRYVRPNGPLRHVVEVPSCDDATTVELSSAAGATGFRSGQYVSIGSTRTGSVILGSPPSGLIGASAFAPQVFDAGAFDDLRVLACTPFEIPAGSVDLEVTITGQGFREEPPDEFLAAVYDDDEESPTFGDYLADPYVTIHDAVWQDSVTVLALVDVLETAPPGYAVTVAVRRAE